MRYPAAEKLEIIRLVEQSALPVRRTLEKIGIPRATFYRWYNLYQTGGPEALDDRHPKPDRVWNRIPDDVRERIVNLALDESALSPSKSVAIRPQRCHHRHPHRYQRCRHRRCRRHRRRHRHRRHGRGA